MRPVRRFLKHGATMFAMALLLSGNVRAEVATPGGLAIKIRALSSIAAESALLLDQLSQSHVTQVYAKAHLDHLQQQIEPIQKALTADKVLPQTSLPVQPRTVLSLASELRHALAATAEHLDRPSYPAVAIRSFRSLQQRLKAMD